MTLTIGCGAYDRTWPLIGGAVAVDGIDLDWEIVPPEVAFSRGMVDGAWQLSELSLCTQLVQLSRDSNLYTAVPVYPSRAFRHSAIYVRADAGIESPADLIGRTIGSPEWQMTANVWARGILADEYGVTLESVQWLQGGVDRTGQEEKVAIDLPLHIRYRSIGPDETLWGLMQEGRVDAIIAPRAPQAFVAGDPRVRRLFPDVKAAEQEYFRRTGIFPIMHLLGIRNDVLAEHPDLPGRLFDAFEAARARAVHELEQVAYFTVMLPWLVDHLAETKTVLGRDYWAYGTGGANATVLDTLCRYAHEQGLTDRRMTAADLFPAT